MSDGGALRITRGRRHPVQLVIAGDIDDSSYPTLTAALLEVPGGPGEIHIDLAGVQYCDLAGLRAIIRLTRSTGHHDHSTRRVILHGIPPYLATVMQILGWDSTPGLITDLQT